MFTFLNYKCMTTQGNGTLYKKAAGTFSPLSPIQSEREHNLTDAHWVQMSLSERRQDKTYCWDKGREFKGATQLFGRWWLDHSETQSRQILL